MPDFPDQLTGKKVIVLGAGRSGLAAAALLARNDAHVILADDNAACVHPDQLEPIIASHLKLVLGQVSPDLVSEADAVVTSPGIPLTHPLLIRARECGLPVIGELELGARHARAPMVAITGTNGKTTTVNWVAHLLDTAGRQAIVCGNVGTALCSVIDRPADWLVVEVSSFQLQTTERFRPHVAAILNLTADHLDRHSTPQDYLAAKARIAANQRPEDALILNADDLAVWSLAASARPAVWAFSLRGPVGRGLYADNGRIMLRREIGTSSEMLLAARELSLPGDHNLANALAAAAAAALCGVGPGALAAGLRNFPGVEHRLERVRQLRNVWYVNDSKATNLSSLEVALRSFDLPIVLIAGGRGKGAPYEPLTALIGARVRHLIVLGEDADRMAAAWNTHVPTDKVADMKEAVDRAARLARGGDVVLLSPACASFDMYRNYEERGQHFKNLVGRLE